MARILCIDFDGVIHSYEHGWQDGRIYGQLVPAFLSWAEQAMPYFELWVHSSRSRQPGALAEMVNWLAKQAQEAGLAVDEIVDESQYGYLRLLNEDTETSIVFRFTADKPPAFLTIDDRAITFMGNWLAPELQPEKLLAFKPWMDKSS